MPNTIDKKQLITAIIKKLEAELETASDASIDAHNTATHSENIADNKYDTLGLEAAYLAHGQSVRIIELQESIDTYLRFQPPQTSEQPAQVTLGSIVVIENNDGNTKNLFIGPTAGGLTIGEGQDAVQVITTSAPLGKLLMNKYQEDEIKLVIDQTSSHLTIIRIY